VITLLLSDVLKFNALREKLNAVGSVSLDLSCATVSNANLRGARLFTTDLANADLQWANLRGADLTGAVIDRSQLTDGQFYSIVRWIDGRPPQ
jgi:uncharacterized protein YjbI with pentapeptide repeats